MLTKDLKEVLKDAQTVTSLASGDRLAVIDANGDFKRISQYSATRSAISMTISSPMWIRFAVSDPGLTSSVLLAIRSQWSHNIGINILVNLLLHPNSTSFNHAQVLSVLSNTAGGNSVLPKCRVLCKQNTRCYLDIYYSPSESNSFDVELIAPYRISMLTPVQNPEIPEGYNVKEFSLTAVGGGG